MTLLALSSSALALGFLHGLGGDHLMAIAALAVNGRRAPSAVPILRTAVGFAFGHTIVLAAGAAVAIGFGVVLPGVVSSGAASAPARFIFAGEGGHITGWNAGVPAPPGNWNGTATRGWFAMALWQALNSYWGSDQPVAGGYVP